LQEFYAAPSEDLNGRGYADHGPAVLL